MITIKKGQWFQALCTYKVSGAAASLSGVTVKSQVRDSAGNLVATLAFQAGQSLGQYLLTADTASWPHGKLFWDIRYTSGGHSTYTDTLEIFVVDAQTK